MDPRFSLTRISELLDLYDVVLLFLTRSSSLHRDGALPFVAIHRNARLGPLPREDSRPRAGFLAHLAAVCWLAIIQIQFLGERVVL